MMTAGRCLNPTARINKAAVQHLHALGYEPIVTQTKLDTSPIGSSGLLLPAKLRREAGKRRARCS